MRNQLCFAAVTRLISIALASISYVWKRHRGLSWFALTSLSSLLWAIDPLGLGPLGGFPYRPMKHEIAPYKEVMSAWPQDQASRLRFATRHFENEVFGPESLEFDLEGNGPYTGLADGRVVRWLDHRKEWETFAVPSSNWNESACVRGNKSMTYAQFKYEEACGRPLGLRFDRKLGILYFADAYYGLLEVGPDGGIGKTLANEVGGKPIKFANDLDIHRNGSIFFTDSSTRHSRKMHHWITVESENTGRLLRYDPLLRKTSVVLEGLCFPNGVQLSNDQSFLLLTETTNTRILRYWLEGPSRGKVEVFANLPGFPDNIRRNEKGQFWVAIHCCRTQLQEVFSTRPWLRYIYFKLPVPASLLYRIVGMRMFTLIALFDEQGHLLDSLEDRDGQVVQLVSEVYPRGNQLWIGTVAHTHIATYSIPT